MSLSSRLRRPIVTFGVALSLLAGVATIQAAAAWTAASSPLVDKPPSVEALEASLALEQARSADLLTRLEELTAGSADLAAALDTAREQIAADAAHAKELQASLDAAKSRLAALEQSIQQARTAVVAAEAAPETRPSGGTASSDRDENHDEDEEEDDD
jgi:DNA repair exonuclease SbcCD ATPase subunit